MPREIIVKVPATKTSKSSFRRFSDEAYEDACALIVSVTKHKTNKKNVHVIVNKDDTNISGLLADVLTQNAVTPKETSQTRKKITFKFQSKEAAEKAFTILNLMKNDELSDDSYNYKNKGVKSIKSVNGVEFEVDSVRSAEVSTDTDGNTIITHIDKTTSDSTSTDSEESNTTTIIIVCAVAVVLIGVAAFIIYKKKRK